MPICDSASLAGECVELQVYSVQHVLATSNGYLSIIMPTGCDALLALNISKNQLRLLSSEAAGNSSEPGWNFKLISQSSNEVAGWIKRMFRKTDNAISSSSIRHFIMLTTPHNL